MASASLRKDSCSYQEQLRRSVGPGMYVLDTPGNDCGADCNRDIPADPYLRYQKYGSSACPPGKSIDDSSELLGLNYRKSHCSSSAYAPGKYSTKGACGPAGKSNPRSECGVPAEDTRLSNPPCTLRATGWNRWEWLCWDPQDRALIPFEWNTSYRTVVKDNHTPIIEKPLDQSKLLPTGQPDGRDFNIPTGPWEPRLGCGAMPPGNPYAVYSVSPNTINNL